MSEEHKDMSSLRVRIWALVVGINMKVGVGGCQGVEVLAYWLCPPGWRGWGDCPDPATKPGGDGRRDGALSLQPWAFSREGTTGAYCSNNTIRYRTLHDQYHKLNYRKLN